MISPKQVARLVSAARRARSHAYAPYSQFRVGACILTSSGRIFAGCNVENATFGATLCAERSAAVAMVAAGERDPVACAVVTGGKAPSPPCGICRQVLAEFARDMVILLACVNDRGRVVAERRTRLASLLPNAFRLDALGTDAARGVGGRSPRAPGRGPRRNGSE